LIINVTDVFPAGIVTELGKVAAPALLDNPMAKPPVPATPLIKTVPVLVAPPIRDVGFRVTDTSLGAVSVKLAV